MLHKNNTNLFESKTSVGNFVLLTTDDEMTSTINKWGEAGKLKHYNCSILNELPLTVGKARTPTLCGSSKLVDG